MANDDVIANVVFAFVFHVWTQLTIINWPAALHCCLLERKNLPGDLDVQ